MIARSSLLWLLPLGLFAAACKKPDDIARLNQAVKANDSERVRALVEDEGVDINSPDPDDFSGLTAFMFAANTGSTEMVKLFLRNRVHVDTRGGWFGTTALLEACMHGHFEVAKLLVEAHAGLEVQDRQGYTALIDAAVAGSPEIVRMLLDAGAKVDAVTTYGTTALEEACENNHDVVAKMLVAAGANVDVKPLFAGRAEADCLARARSAAEASRK